MSSHEPASEIGSLVLSRSFDQVALAFIRTISGPQNWLKTSVQKSAAYLTGWFTRTHSYIHNIEALIKFADPFTQGKQLFFRSNCSCRNDI